jgi:hypothetical protein
MTRCGRSTTGESERERFDRRRPQIDPQPSATILRTGRRNRLKLPFKLRTRGACSFSDWMPKGHVKDRGPGSTIVDGDRSLLNGSYA